MSSGTEELHKKSFIGIEVCLFDLNIKDIDLIIKSFQKCGKLKIINRILVLFLLKLVVLK